MIIEISKGAVIKALGIKAVVEKILFQHIDVGNERQIRDMADVEFIDDKGNYRHWQSWSDGGTLTFNKKRYVFEREV